MSKTKPGKTRLDRLLVDRGLAETRQKAQALILAGKVLVDEQKVEKCGASFGVQAAVRLLGEPMRYVSRGGLKLEDALDAFGVDPGKRNPSAEALLRRISRESGMPTRVFAVDVGTNQLDWKLRHDPRVMVLEQLNARYLEPEQIPARFELVTMDVSFISATLILPVLPPLLAPRAELLVLVKPQFEVGRGQVGRGGVVRDPRLHQEAVTKVSAKLAELSFREVTSHESSLPGAEGNREFFLHAIWQKPV